MSFIFSRRNGQSQSGSEITKNEALGCEDDGTDYILSIKHLDELIHISVTHMHCWKYGCMWHKFVDFWECLELEIGCVDGGDLNCFNYHKHVTEHEHVNYLSNI